MLKDPSLISGEIIKAMARLVTYKIKFFFPRMELEKLKFSERQNASKEREKNYVEKLLKQNL